MSYMIIFAVHKDHDVVTQYILRHLAGLFVALPQKVKMPVGGRRGCCSLQSNDNNLYSVTGPAAGLNLAWDNVKERWLMYMGVCQSQKKYLVFKGLNLRSSCLVLLF